MSKNENKGDSSMNKSKLKCSPQRAEIQIQAVKSPVNDKDFIEDFNTSSSIKTMTLPIENELNFCEKSLKSMLNIISDFKCKSVVDDSKIANYYALKLINLSEKVCLAIRSIPHYIDCDCNDGYEKFEQIDEQIANAWDTKIGYTKQGWLYIKLPVMLPKIKQHNVQVIALPLQISLKEFLKNKHVNKNIPSVICYCHVYSKEVPPSRYLDHDNIETKAITDIITDFVLYDDGPQLLNHYHCSAIGEHSHTEIFIVPQNEFAQWILCEQNGDFEALSTLKPP